MPREQFDALREKLLRGGIAPRYVRRYVAELRDHFDDVVREEVENGSARDAAEQAARARIGSDDELAAVMLARPDLRSMTARFPWAVFGFMPLFMLTLVVSAVLLLQGTLIFLDPAWPISWTRPSVDTLNWLTNYAAPLALAAILFAIGIRQRTSSRWIVVGLSVTCIVGGFHEMGVRWSSVPSEPSELQLSFALMPPFPSQMIAWGVFRAAINLALVGTGYWLWLRHAPETAAQ